MKYQSAHKLRTFSLVEVIIDHEYGNFINK